MWAYIAVAAIIGYVIGYNCYIHVWHGDLATSCAVAVASFAAFLFWFTRISRGELGRR